MAEEGTVAVVSMEAVVVSTAAGECTTAVAAEGFTSAVASTVARPARTA